MGAEWHLHTKKWEKTKKALCWQCACSCWWTWGAFPSKWISCKAFVSKFSRPSTLRNFGNSHWFDFGSSWNTNKIKKSMCGMMSTKVCLWILYPDIPRPIAFLVPQIWSWLYVGRIKTNKTNWNLNKASWANRARMVRNLSVSRLVGPYLTNFGTFGLIFDPHRAIKKFA